MKLSGKSILLGVTGGIAAYKAAELLRLFMREGASVRVVMTRSATRFITPLTFRALSGNPVLSALYQDDLQSSAGDADESGVEHIDLVRTADLVVIAPATANSLAKAAWGLADDALSTVVVAAGTNILWAPAMNHRMWKNPVTQDNVARLRRMGHVIADVEDGWMACREYGPGRMAEPEHLLEQVVELVGHPQDLAGARILITAGRTEEPIDPVRVLTNRSSGRMGVALAEEARDRGATVTLLAGPMDVEPPEGVTVERIVTAQEMHDRAHALFPEQDVLVMAAAVGDYRSAAPSGKKLKRSSAKRSLALAPNPDILAGLAKGRREDQVLIGFALETNDAEANGRRKLEAKGVDLLVVNAPEDAIGATTNTVTLMEPDKSSRRLPTQSKREVARRILDWTVARRETAQRGKHGDGSQERARGA